MNARERKGDESGNGNNDDEKDRGIEEKVTMGTKGQCCVKMFHIQYNVMGSSVCKEVALEMRTGGGG